MMGPVPSSSVVPPQMEPKRGLWFGKLSMEWWIRPPQANMVKFGEKSIMKDTYPASRANAEGSNDIPMDGTNNVGLEFQMRQAGFINDSDEPGGDLIPNTRHRPFTGTKRMELDFREPIINTPLCLWWHPEKICKKQQFRSKNCRRRLRLHYTTSL